MECLSKLLAMQFELTNTPNTLMILIKEVLKQFLGKFWLYILMIVIGNPPMNKGDPSWASFEPRMDKQ